MLYKWSTELRLSINATLSLLSLVGQLFAERRGAMRQMCAIVMASLT